MYGLSRYIFGKNYILDSSSFEDIFKKIAEDEQKYDKKNLYYSKDILFLEFKFLFLIQYIEHRTAEFISNLASKNLIKESRVKEQIKRCKDTILTRRYFSPYALLIHCKLSLGELLEIIDKHSDFEDRLILSKKLKSFNKLRIDFIHKSFSNSKNIKLILINGISVGEELLNYYDPPDMSL